MKRKYGWWLCLVMLVGGIGGCTVKQYKPTPVEPVGPTPQPAPVQPKPVPHQLAIFEADFNKVQVGWTAAQVEAAIGKPWRTMPPDQRGRTYWHYRVRIADAVDVDGEIEFGGVTVTGKVIF